MAELITAIPQLSQLPQCILPAYEAIAAAGCGLDLACICGNENFYFTLVGVIGKACTNPLDILEATSSTQSICAKEVPGLNKNRGPEVVAAITILTVISTIAFALRVIARRMSKVELGIDDWLVALALLFAYALTIDQYFAVHYGLGKHMLMLSPEHIIPFVKTYFVATVVFPVSAAAVKLSVLFFYHRIFPGRAFRIASIVIGLTVIVWFIAFIILQFVTCIPLAYLWDKTIPGGHCISANYVAYFGTSPLDILTNVAILILPIPDLWNLQMQRWKKFAITLIFVLGSFATVGAIVRVPLLVELKPTDVSYTVVDSGIWLSVECNIGILSASLPMLRPILSKLNLTPTLRSRFSPNRTPYYGAGGSQRLPDGEKSSGNTGHSSTLGGGSNGGGSGNGSANIYQGGKNSRAWYNTAVSAKHDDGGSEGSQEEMVPVGQIGVRQEVDWETKDDASAINNPPLNQHTV